MPRRTASALPSEAEAARGYFMDAAEACFEKYGIAKTTMDDIAKMAGVSRPTVYRHFSDRDGLILAVVMRRSRQLIDRAQKFLRKQGSLEEQIVEGLIFLADNGRKDPFVRLPVSLAHMDLLAYEMWEPILIEARERGELRDDLDLRAIATWFASLILMLVGRGDLEPGINAQRELLRLFVLPAFAPAPASGRVNSTRSRRS